MSANSLTIDRTTILHGPCLLITNGQTLYSKDDVVVMPDPSFFDIGTSVRGKQTDQHLKDKIYKVTFTPSGEVTSGLLAVLLATAQTQIGSSVFGGGTALAIVSLTDTVNNYVVLKNASITKLPQLTFASDKTLYGSMEYTGLGQNNTAYNAANRFVSVATKVLSGAITAVTNATPAVITSNGHGLANGDPVSISGVAGTTAVNLNGYAAAVTANTFEISTTPSGSAPVAANANYTSGGAWTLGWPLVPANIITSGFSGQWATTVPSGNIAGTSDASPDVITSSSAHGLNVGDRVIIASVGGDTAVDGAFWVVSVPSPATFAIGASQGGAAIAGSGSYTSGGTFTRSNALDNFDTEAGAMVSFELSLTPKRANTLGTYDMLFSALTVTVKCLPIGPTVIDIINASQTEGANAQLGQSMAALGQNLFLNGNGLYFLAYNTFVKINSAVYSAEKLRVGDFSFVATYSYPGNVAKPLFAVATSPITP